MQPSDFAFDSAAYNAATVCKACKGSGKKGRGCCRACEGTKDAGLDHPRIKFNWGCWYAAGYAYGLRDAAIETHTSEPVWLEWSGTAVTRAA